MNSATLSPTRPASARKAKPAAAATPTPHAPAVVRAAALHRTLRAEPMTGCIGAEISGIDLAITPDKDETRALRDLLLRHRVIVFRDQDITAAQQVALARMFGDLEVHPVFKHHEDHDELVVLEGGAGAKNGRENCYHADVTWRAVPSMGSILRSVVCPDVGGDTIWTNMVAAYEHLAPTTQAAIQNLNAVHDIVPGFADRASPAQLADIRQRFPAQTHPAVRIHPETGEKILYVNEGFVTHFENFVESSAFRTMTEFRTSERALLDYLFSQAKYPEYQMRLRWKKNTIAFWDNRATQHYAVQDYLPAQRVMWRATIIGEPTTTPTPKKKKKA